MAEAANDAGISRNKQMMAMESGNNPMAIIPGTLGEVVTLAGAIAASGLAPYGMNTGDKVTVAILMGLELGLPPMQAIQNIAVVNGRPSLYGDIGLSLIYRSGLLEEFEEGWDGEETEATADFPNTFKAWVRMKRKGLPAVRMEFSVGDAKRANLWDGMGIDDAGKKAKSPWHLYPKTMLRWRARWLVWRALFTDVLKNMQGVEELQDSVIDVTPNEPTPAPGKPKADIAAALKEGPKVEVVYTSRAQPAAAPKPAQTAPDNSFSGNGAEEAVDVEVVDDTGGGGEATEREAEQPETTIQAESVQVNLDGIVDIFEQSAITELATALSTCPSAAALKVLEDEFLTTIQMASVVGAERMREMFAARTTELGG